MQFVDECKLSIKAGDGGNGMLAWRREAHYPEGGPWGGDGGNGADIIFIGDNNYTSLFHLRYQKKVIGENGEKGGSKICSGKDAPTTYIHVPIGTQIIDSSNNKIIADITKIGQIEVVASGGKGGHGNVFFKSSFNKAPTLYERGDIGEKIDVELKLKYIADIGLVGLPNAGKSSLVSAVTNVKPKIANYQFTTLVPVLGTIVAKNNQQYVIADIPGIIENAHEGKGLGLEFLKHIERCHLLVHVISLDKNDHDDIVQAYQTIKNELNSYSESLLEKKVVIVANKCDVIDSNIQLKKLKKVIDDETIIELSAKEKINLDEFTSYAIKSIEEYKKTNALDVNSISQIKIIELKQDKEIDKSFTYVKDSNDRWIITSKYLSYWLHKIPLNTKDNLLRFNQKMAGTNLEKKLKDIGAKTKDVIVIDGVEFELD